ncbi:MAG: hypothetical protein KDJ78_11625 [Rhodobacteraceae bacterium]|uniref:hypothetical protein n=1 Tax=Amaricoccus sp. TaxID=1872485 RepID=UPI001DA79AF8|nr:hypothetical protein [Amaricoccus sp.]MCB1374801.1 hypothetical protein [Paracoccaceae bacterium]MCB1402418.1 hypothetical protein [Paracoccaceae bacterium]HRW16959.1 hypothetical protein [Amaricoccus sp.]
MGVSPFEDQRHDGTADPACSSNPELLLRTVDPEDKTAVDRMLDRLTGYSMGVAGVPKAAVMRDAC